MHFFFSAMGAAGDTLMSEIRVQVWSNSQQDSKARIYHFPLICELSFVSACTEIEIIQRNVVAPEQELCVRLRTGSYHSVAKKKITECCL